MKGSWDCNIKDLGVAIVITKAKLAALILSGTLDFGKTIRRYIYIISILHRNGRVITNM